MSACGEYGDLVDPTEPPLHEDGDGVVGTLGGTVIVGDQSSAIYGAAAVIPEGALTAPIDVQISEAPNITVEDYPDAQFVEFSPEDADFNQQVILTLPISSSMLKSGIGLKIIMYDAHHNHYSEIAIADLDEEYGLVFFYSGNFGFFAIISGDSDNGYFTDPRDNNRYKWVSIGQQKWMAENLRYQMDGSGCFTDYCSTYGLLYTYYAAMEACPSGWHLPSDDETIIMEAYLGMPEWELNAYQLREGGQVGHKMKSTYDWYNGGNGNNASGLNMLPSGIYYNNPDITGFMYFGKNGYFWNSTMYGHDEAWTRGVYHGTVGVNREHKTLNEGFPVRCIKDDEGGPAEGTFTDHRDVQSYRWKRIGNQVWMINNLNWNSSGGSWCYSNDPDKCDTFGRLYNWTTALTACPSGWHLPSDAEFKEVESYLGMSNADVNSEATMRASGEVGTKMKYQAWWANNGSGTNSSGFTVLPTGMYDADHQKFEYLYSNGYFWTRDEYNTNQAWARGVYSSSVGVNRDDFEKTAGFSIRCIRD